MAVTLQYKVLSHWLEGSGWVEALQEAELTTPGIADPSSRPRRSLGSNQVTACVLYIRRKNAYDVYVATNAAECISACDVNARKIKVHNPSNDTLTIGTACLVICEFITYW